MKAKVSVVKSRTVNLGDYNSTRFEYGVELDLGEIENTKVILEAKEKAEGLVNDWLDEEQGKL